VPSEKLALARVSGFQHGEANPNVHELKLI